MLAFALIGTGIGGTSVSGGDTANPPQSPEGSPHIYLDRFLENATEIDVDALEPVEAARRIDARPALKSYLVAALDDWLQPRRQARPDNTEALRRLRRSKGS